MDVLEAVKGLEQHFTAFFASAKEKVEQELPVLGNLAQQASTNPAVTALLNAVHLPEAPELLQGLADEIGKIDQALADAKAAGATAATLAAQPPAEAPEPAAPQA